MESFVKKIVAYFEEREEFASSQEEFNEFLEGNRPDFNDQSVIAVKFAFSISENFDDAEESSWFLSPHYVEIMCDNINYQDSLLEEGYGPRLASEIPPEVLSLKFEKRGTLNAYDEFYLDCLKNNLLNLTIREKLEKFAEFVDKYPY